VKTLLQLIEQHSDLSPRWIVEAYKAGVVNGMAVASGHFMGDKPKGAVYAEAFDIGHRVAREFKASNDYRRSYGDRRDFKKIDVYRKDGADQLVYMFSTTWANSLREARCRASLESGLNFDHIYCKYGE
jgi:hypothetical protein